MKFNRQLTKQEKTLLQELSQKPSLNLKDYGYRGLRYEMENNLELKKDVEKLDILFKDIFDGFYRFYNFIDNNQIRFGYNWGNNFDGVGYMKISEVLNGSFED